MWNLSQLMILFGIGKIVMKESQEKLRRPETYFPMLKKDEK